MFYEVSKRFAGNFNLSLVAVIDYGHNNRSVWWRSRETVALVLYLKSLVRLRYAMSTSEGAQPQRHLLEALPKHFYCLWKLNLLKLT